MLGWSHRRVIAGDRRVEDRMEWPARARSSIELTSDKALEYISWERSSRSKDSHSTYPGSPICERFSPSMANTSVSSGDSRPLDLMFRGRSRESSKTEPREFSLLPCWVCLSMAKARSWKAAYDTTGVVSGRKTGASFAKSLTKATTISR